VSVEDLDGFEHRGRQIPNDASGVTRSSHQLRTALVQC
jgi:hypothetical protein